MAKPREWAELFLTGTVWLIIFCGTLAPLAFSLGTWLPRFNSTLLEGNNIYIVCTALLLAYGLMRLLYRTDLSHPNYYWLFGFLVATATALKVFYAFSFEQEFFSDFRTMWNRALQIYEAGAFLPPDRPQNERPLASLVPLVWMFGPSEAVFKLANIVYTVFAALMVSCMTAKIISRHASILAFVLIMAAPEVNFALLIPTHDIPGAFYLVLYLFIYFLAWRTLSGVLLDRNSPHTYLTIVIIVLSLFVTAVLLDIQRNILAPIALSLLLFSSYLYFTEKKHPLTKRSVVIILVMLTAPLALQNLAGKVLRDAGVLATYSFEQQMKGPSITHPHTFSDGTYASGEDFSSKYLKNIDDTHVLERLRKSLILSDIYYNILERPSNYLMRSQRLYLLGTQGGFYYGRLKGLSEQEARNISRIKDRYNTTFVTSYLALLLAAVFYALFGRARNFSNALTLPLIIMSVITLALLLIAENQPRYLFMGWFLWSAIIAWLIDSFFTRRADVLQHNNRNKSPDALFLNWKAVTLVLIATSLSYLLFRGLFYFSDMRLIDMRTWSTPNCNARIDPEECVRSIINFEPDISDKSYSTLKLQIPVIPRIDDYARVEQTFDVSPGELYDLSLFVKSPYKRGDGQTGFFDINVYINGNVVQTLHLEDTDEYQFLHFQRLAPENDQLHVALEVRSKIDRDRPSWQRASEVHFKFMSLYAAEGG